MKNIIHLLILLLAFTSCQEVEFAKKPKPLLDEDTMVEIITDMVIYDAAFSVNEFQLRKFDKDLNQFLIYKYEIDSIVLAKNIAFYNEQYDQNLNIYKRVGENIDQKRDYFDSIRKVNDSIQRAKNERKRDATDKSEAKLNLLKNENNFFKNQQDADK